ncbi:MAG TPA: DUF2911 domain-containing protein [Dyadobacter sp.]|jgi:hypothetical protein|nr:DUF2911 domain-containing protein [Dyadobacter sp.]
MKKTLSLSLLFVFLSLSGFFGYRKYSRSLSPAGTALWEKDNLHIEVQYGRPAKKNRYIFGRAQDKALAPYGRVWRTGANEATVITFEEDVLFSGKEVKAGSYSLWTVPGPGSWQVILNAETGQWGTEYNDGKNVLKVEVPIRIHPQVKEVFSIYFEEIEGGTNLVLNWDQTEAVIPIQPR